MCCRMCTNTGEHKLGTLAAPAQPGRSEQPLGYRPALRKVHTPAPRAEPKNPTSSLRSFATFGPFAADGRRGRTRSGRARPNREICMAPSDLWYDRVDQAICELNQVLEDNRRALVEQVTLRAELRVALFKAQLAHHPATAANFDDARPSKKPLRAAAAAAIVLGSASYAQAYDYVDARGYRHWCHDANCAEGKVVDENDLAWQPPPGVKWQVVEEPAKSARAE